MSEEGLKRARYSDVERRLWNDARFRALSPVPPCGQGLWLYLLTTPELGVLPGLIVMGESAMAEHLRWPLKAFREAFAEVLAKGMAEADWEARLVVLPKAIGRYRPQSPNVVTSWRQHWLDVPECALKSKYYRMLKAFSEDLPEAFTKAFEKAIKDPSPNQIQEQEQDQEQEQEQEQEQLPEPVRASGTRLKASRENGGDSEREPERRTAEIREVWAHFVAHWTDAIGGTKPPVLSPDRRRQIRARLVEGRTVTDLKLALDGLWLNGWNVENGQTHPELVFRNNGQVEKYMAKAPPPLEERKPPIAPEPLKPWFDIGQPKAEGA